MTRQALMLVITIAGATSMSCTSPSPLREDFGRSVAAMHQAQRPDQASARGSGPLEGLDGQAAQAVIRRYHSSFEKDGGAASAPAPIQPPPGFAEALGATGVPPTGPATDP